jgi:hypothetical protein
MSFALADPGFEAPYFADPGAHLPLPPLPLRLALRAAQALVYECVCGQWWGSVIMVIGCSVPVPRDAPCSLWFPLCKPCALVHSCFGCSAQVPLSKAQLALDSRVFRTQRGHFSPAFVAKVEAIAQNLKFLFAQRIRR